MDTEKTFEQRLAELEKMVARMEAGQMSLDDTLTSYETGMAMVRALENELKAAEKRLLVLSGGELTEGGAVQ